MTFASILDKMKDDAETNPVLSVFCWFILALGVFECFCYFWRLCRSFGYYLFRPRNLDTYKRYGNNVGREVQDNRTWALVTGASDGLGLAYCHELASRGFNIILLSRNPEKLKKAADSIKGVKTHIIAQDLSKIYKYEDYERIVKEIPEDMDIGLLINNAGLGNSGPFKDVDGI